MENGESPFLQATAIYKAMFTKPVLWSLVTNSVNSGIYPPSRTHIHLSLSSVAHGSTYSIYYKHKQASSGTKKHRPAKICPLPAVCWCVTGAIWSHFADPIAVRSEHGPNRHKLVSVKVIWSARATDYVWNRITSDCVFIKPIVTSVGKLWLQNGRNKNGPRLEIFHAGRMSMKRSERVRKETSWLLLTSAFWPIPAHYNHSWNIVIPILPNRMIIFALMYSWKKKQKKTLLSKSSEKSAFFSSPRSLTNMK